MSGAKKETKPQKILCGHTWGRCGGNKNAWYEHVCGVWIYPGQSHTHICGTCQGN